MSDEFDKTYWETHWSGAHGDSSAVPANPALGTEIATMQPGTALDAGSGEGAEAAWLAAHGWNVTAVDISANALRSAAELATPESGSVTWIEADLTIWEPKGSFDLVTTFYAHPEIPQLAFYQRIAHWVAPGGTLLIVGHHDTHGNGHAHPDNAITDPERISAFLSPAQWTVQTAEVRERNITERHGHPMVLRDVVVRARRR